MDSVTEKGIQRSLGTLLVPCISVSGSALMQHRYPERDTSEGKADGNGKSHGTVLS